MTPAARIGAAIECLDEILAGASAEQVLTRWARRSRFAGSKDRASVRDHVFDVLRCRRSFAALGGAETGRGLMLGALRAAGGDPETVFGSGGHAPERLSDAERVAGRQARAGAEAGNLPDWLWAEFRSSHGAETERVAAALCNRAPVFLRVNAARGSRQDAIDQLASDGIAAHVHASAGTALEIESGARRLRQSHAYLSGLVELQDGASQAVCERLPLSPGKRVLDFCAGGGGKSLAIAAQQGVHVFAHDISEERLRDLPGRADRARTPVVRLKTQEVPEYAPFDIVLCDVPCSGSGSWRRAPDAKWRLTKKRLKELCALQSKILKETAAFVSGDGILAYATCSLLNCENTLIIEHFLSENPDWEVSHQEAWTLDDGTDGFFAAHLRRR